MSSRRSSVEPAPSSQRVTRSMSAVARDEAVSPSAQRTERYVEGTAGTSPTRRSNAPNPQTPLPTIPGRTSTAWGADGSPGLEVPVAVGQAPQASLQSSLTTSSTTHATRYRRLTQRYRDPPATIPEESSGTAADPMRSLRPVPSPRVNRFRDSITVGTIAGRPATVRFETMQLQRDVPSEGAANQAASAAAGIPSNAPENNDQSATINREESLLDRVGNAQPHDTNVPPPPEPPRDRIAREFARHRTGTIANLLGLLLVALVAGFLSRTYRDQLRSAAVSVWENIPISTRPYTHTIANVHPASAVPQPSSEDAPAPAHANNIHTPSPTSARRKLDEDRLSSLASSAWAFASRMSLVKPSSQVQPILGPLFGERLDKLETDVTAIKTTLGLHEDTLAKLKAILPDQIVVRVDETTRKYEIPEDFWKALQDKLADDYNIEPYTISSDWDLFWAKNKHQFEVYMRREFDKRIKPELDDIKQNHVITNQMFVKLIDEKWERMTVHLRKHAEELARPLLNIRDNVIADGVDAATAAATRIVRNETHRIVQNAIWSLPAKELAMLAQANGIQNRHEAANSVNFFSTGLGARIDYLTTSPTKKRPGSLTQRLFKLITGIGKANPPLMALSKWDEATDCWCGATTNATGLSRILLGVRMKHSIFPRRFTLEHISPTGTLDIASAPKGLEIWAYMPNATLRAQVQARISPTGQSMCEPSFDEKYVCLGTMRYDIHALNNVQTFPLDVDLKALGALDGISRAVVRVVSNWGRNYTCIYRVRMHGDLAKPEELESID